MDATAVYRDHTLAACAQRDRLAAAHNAELTRASGAARAFGDRVTRIAAGAALTTVGALLWLGTLAATLGLSALVTPSLEKLALLTIPAAWGVAGLVALAARALATRALGRRYPAFVVGDDPWRDLTRLGDLESPSVLRRRAARLETASVGLPLTGLALVAPISIHLVVAILFGVGLGFVKWLALSVVIAGSAHIALIACAWLFAQRLRDQPLANHRNAGWRALLWTTGVSAVPFALLYLIPPLVVLATGALFVPFAFDGLRRTVERERRGLGDGCGNLPQSPLA
jgi:hypothetical protein